MGMVFMLRAGSGHGRDDGVIGRFIVLETKRYVEWKGAPGTAALEFTDLPIYCINA